MSDDRLERGLDVTEQLFGARVPVTLGPEEPESARDLRNLFIEHCFGDAWSRPTLDLRTHSLLTLAILTTLGAENQLRSHVKGALNLGISKDEIVEVLIHAAAYTGVPPAVGAYQVARAVFAEVD